MRREIEGQNPAALVLDDEETVPHTEGRGRHGKQVEGHDRLAVMVKKGQPFLGRIPPAMDPPQVARDGPLGEHEAELFRTATCWRRARTSTAMSVRLWKKTRAAAIRARTKDSTDHRFNMT